eukprot:5087236-Amphidinium_carterae.2
MSVNHCHYATDLWVGDCLYFNPHVLILAVSCGHVTHSQHAGPACVQNWSQSSPRGDGLRCSLKPLVKDIKPKLFASAVLESWSCGVWVQSSPQNYDLGITGVWSVYSL